MNETAKDLYFDILVNKLMVQVDQRTASSVALTLSVVERHRGNSSHPAYLRYLPIKWYVLDRIESFMRYLERQV